jgi:ATP-binding cassette subfamily B protein
MKTVNLNAAYFPAVELLSALVTVAILLYGGYQAIDGAVTVGVLVAFVTALNNFFDPIQQLSQLYTTYQSGMAALDKIFELLDEQPDLVDAPGAIELGRLRGEITLSRTCRSATRDRTSGRCARPTCTCRRGRPWRSSARREPGSPRWPSSWPASTTPTRAACWSTATTCGPVTSASLRSQMGIVPQEAFLFSGTVRENIVFGKPEATLTEVREAAGAVGADAFIMELAEGYDTEVGERGVQLSAGQRQLIAFARALIADPRILVLDEATSNVDIHTEGEIERGLRRLLAGRTAIVIAHRSRPSARPAGSWCSSTGTSSSRARTTSCLAAEGAYFRLYRDWAEQAAA